MDYLTDAQPEPAHHYEEKESRDTLLPIVNTGRCTQHLSERRERHDVSQCAPAFAHVGVVYPTHRHKSLGVIGCSNPPFIPRF